MALPSEATVSCRWCGKPTKMLGTRNCDSCFELLTRLSQQPALAERMMEEVAPRARRVLESLPLGNGFEWRLTSPSPGCPGRWQLSYGGQQGRLASLLEAATLNAAARTVGGDMGEG